MDLEMKFLTVFYALLGGVTSLALLAVLIDAQLVAMLVVVVAMFVAMVLLAATTIGGEDDGARE